MDSVAAWDFLMIPNLTSRRWHTHGVGGHHMRRNRRGLGVRPHLLSWGSVLVEPHFYCQYSAILSAHVQQEQQQKQPIATIFIHKINGRHQYKKMQQKRVNLTKRTIMQYKVICMLRVYLIIWRNFNAVSLNYAFARHSISHSGL